MKRPEQDVVGQPIVAIPRRDVAGTSRSSFGIDVASFRHALSDPMATRARDAALIEEFVDFLEGDPVDSGAGGALPDPVFQERLRRRLWRTYAQTHLKDRGEAH